MTLLSGGLLQCAATHAAPLDLSDMPLFFGISVKPNLLFVIDDSGSMDWEFVTVKHWQADFYDYDIGGKSTQPTHSNGTTINSIISNDATEVRWAGFTTTSNYTSGVANNSMLSYYYDNGNGASTGGSIYSVSCNSSTNGNSLFNCNSAYTLYRPSAATNSSIVKPTPTSFLWDWRLFSSDLNGLYFNPGVTYKPWPGTGLTDARYTAACNVPIYGTTSCPASRNLGATDFLITVWNDDKGYSGTAPGRGTNINMTTGANGKIDLWDTYTLYTVKSGTDTVTAQTFKTTFCPTTMPTLASGSMPPSPWQNCWDKPTTANGSTSNPYRPGRLLVQQNGSTVSSTSSVTITLSDGSTTVQTIAQLKQNIANWYQYYRKRQYVARNSLGVVVNAYPKFRYGITAFNEYDGSPSDALPVSDYSTLFMQMPVAAYPPFDDHNKALMTKIYGFQWQSNSTPGPASLNRAGQYYQGNWQGSTDPIPASPILSSAEGGQCQQNYAIIMTDGFWNYEVDKNNNIIVFSGLGDKDGDQCSNTIADVAAKYYDIDLSTLDNLVRPNPDDDAVRQHMVTFGIAFGAEGGLAYPSTRVDNPATPQTESGWPSEVGPFPSDRTGGATQCTTTAAGKWGNPGASDSAPAKIDDLWHAAYNSRGAFFSAKNADQMRRSFLEAVSKIDGRVGSGSGLSMSTGFVTSRSLTYIASFNNTDWTGALGAVKLKTDGSFDVDANGIPLWQWTTDTTGSFPAFNSRNVWTRTWNAAGTPSAIPFTWASLNASQQGYLNVDGYGVTDGKGQARLDFLRGKGVASSDASWVVTNDFRKRSRVLGDIVNSSPFFVDYSTATTDKGVVFVGANDGMLHAFDTTNGQELFAYVPNSLFKNLNALPSSDYKINHLSYVDGAVVVKEIDTATGTKKILVGTLRGGGRGVYALDVTDPYNFTAANVLWEYTQQDLGFTFGTPTIAKMMTGDWAVVLGNGYNNTDDGTGKVKKTIDATGNLVPVSATGNAVLYVLNVQTGSLLKKLDTGKGFATSADAATPNGLASPAVIFDPNTSSRIAKYAYAGDLQGNLWKFDLSSSDAANWKIAYNTADCATNALTPCRPLFIATSPESTNPVQPITTRPQVDVHPSIYGYLIYFGTGKYIEPSDNASTSAVTQSFYSVWDRDSTSSTFYDLLPQKRTHLLQQTIEGLSGGYYVVSENPISWPSYNPASPSNPCQPPSSASIAACTSTTGYLGWYLDFTYGSPLNNHAEKQVTNSLLVDKKIIFNTLLPSKDICASGGSSTTFVLDAIDGGRLEVSPFVGVGFVTSPSDSTKQVPVSGKPSGESLGILFEQALVEDLATGAQYITAGSSSGSPSSIQIDSAVRKQGRQFWRNLQQ